MTSLARDLANALRMSAVFLHGTHAAHERDTLDECHRTECVDAAIVLARVSPVGYRRLFPRGASVPMWIDAEDQVMIQPERLTGYRALFVEVDPLDETPATGNDRRRIYLAEDGTIVHSNAPAPGWRPLYVRDES